MPGNIGATNGTLFIQYHELDMKTVRMASYFLCTLFSTKDIQKGSYSFNKFTVCILKFVTIELIGNCR